MNLRWYVREAFKAGQAVDDFDLVSEDPTSAEAFKKLVLADEKACRELVEYILKNWRK